jgi:DNA (cytosine-5)-methyltransferase 1
VAYPAQLQRDGGDHNARISLERSPVSEFGNGSRPQDVADAYGKRRDGRPRRAQARRQQFTDGMGKDGIWPAEPPVGRMANGISRRVDRLRCLGNAVVPQVADLVGRQMFEIIGGEK